MTSLLFALLMAIQQNAILTIPPVEASSLSVDELKTIAVADAEKYNLRADRFLATINCESGFSIDAISPTGDYGIAQWNIKSHDMTIAQADDPYYALQQMAIAWKNGHANEWTCYRQLFKK